jgi:hypothetical protein
MLSKYVFVAICIAPNFSSGGKKPNVRGFNPIIWGLKPQCGWGSLTPTINRGAMQTNSELCVTSVRKKDECDGVKAGFTNMRVKVGISI